MRSRYGLAAGLEKNDSGKLAMSFSVSNSCVAPAGPQGSNNLHSMIQRGQGYFNNGFEDAGILPDRFSRMFPTVEQHCSLIQVSVKE